MELLFVIDVNDHRGFTQSEMIFVKMDLGLILLCCVDNIAK